MRGGGSDFNGYDSNWTNNALRSDDWRARKSSAKSSKGADEKGAVEYKDAPAPEQTQASYSSALQDVPKASKGDQEPTTKVLKKDKKVEICDAQCGCQGGWRPCKSKGAQGDKSAADSRITD